MPRTRAPAPWLVVLPALLVLILLLTVLSGMGPPATPARAPHAAAAVIVSPARLAPAAGPSVSTEVWTNLSAYTTYAAPPARIFSVMSYDPAQSYGLLFSGIAEHANGYAYFPADVWSFTPAGGWTNITPGAGAGSIARYGAAMAYDTVDGQMIMYGGCDADYCPAPYIFTYGGAGAFILDGTAQDHGGQPGGLMYEALSDAPNGGGPSGGGALLFGGCTAINGAGDCTAFSGNTFLVNYPGGAGAGGGTNQPTWTPTGGGGAQPSARAFVGMTWDPAMNAVIMYGGYNGAHVLNDTWAFSHGTWTNISHLVGPSPYVANGDLVYDNNTGALILAGGVGEFGTQQAITWALPPGGHWMNITSTAGSPTVRAGQVSATFPRPDFPLVYGGVAPTGSYLKDTWIFGEPVLTNPTVAPLATDLGDKVAFAGWASGGLPPVTLHWQLGDGTTLASAYGNHTYAHPNTYLANLSAIDTYGVTNRTQVTITINPDPTVTAAAAPLSTTTGTRVQFWGNVTGGTGPFTYSWNFGDGSPLAGAAAVGHRYKNPGVFQANVTAIDAAGYWVHASVNVTVVVGPITVFGSAMPNLGPSPLSVTFHAGGTGGQGNLGFTWVFADGSAPSHYEGATHVYNASGYYNATVWANDSYGHSASLTLLIIVYAPLTTTLALSANNTLPGVGVTLTSAALGGYGGLTYAWDLNGTAVAGATASSLDYVPQGAGTYWFAVEVTDGPGDAAWAFANLTVVAPSSVPPPTVTLAANRTTLVAPGTVIYNATVAGGVAPFTFLWSLNGTPDASLSTTDQFVQAIGHPGFYNVSVQVTDDLGHVGASGSVMVVALAVSVPPPQVSIVANRTSLVAGGVVILNATVTGGLAPLSYVWTLNGTPDAALSTTGQVVDQLTHPGSYVFTLQVTDALDHTGVSAPVTVQATALPTPGSGNGGGGTGALTPSNLLNPHSPWFLLLLALILVAIVAAVLLTRRRRTAPAASAEIEAGGGAFAGAEGGVVPTHPWSEDAIPLEPTASDPEMEGPPDVETAPAPTASRPPRAPAAAEEEEPILIEDEPEEEASASPAVAEPAEEPAPRPAGEEPTPTEAVAEPEPASPAPEEPSTPTAEVSPEPAPEAAPDATPEPPAAEAAPAPAPTPVDAPSKPAKPKMKLKRTAPKSP